MGGDDLTRRKIYIKDWSADVFFCSHHYDEHVLQEALEDVEAPWSVIVRMREIARDDEYNTGFTYSNERKRQSVVVIGKSTNAAEFVNTFVHELRHLSDDIAISTNIDLRGEGVGYLQGEIARELADIVGLFICPKCRTRNRLLSV